MQFLNSGTGRLTQPSRNCTRAPSLMSAILIVLVLLLLAVALASFFRNRPTITASLPHAGPAVLPVSSRSLFDPPSAQRIAEIEREQLRANWLTRVSQGDLSVLVEAQADSALYNEVLTALVTQCNDVREIALYLSRHTELRANAQLAQAYIKLWEAAPNRNDLATLLHLAAVSDDADVYWLAVDVAKQAWEQGRLTQVSPSELAAAIEAQYWLMHIEARESGAGFVLKRYVASVRRELMMAK